MNKTSESELQKFTDEINNSIENDTYEVTKKVRKLFSTENDSDDDMLKYLHKILDEICPQESKKTGCINIIEKARNNSDFACEILDMYHNLFVDLLYLYKALKIETKLHEYFYLTGLREKGVLEEFDQLRAEKVKRYQRRRKNNVLRETYYKICKDKGMTDAETYRKIIEIENEDRKRPIKPGTNDYHAAMNSLRVWKSRTFSQKKDVTH